MNFHKNAIIAAQIITETLPISSSTHVFIVDTIFRQLYPFTEKLGTEAFMDLLFLPTLFVLGIFFRHRIYQNISILFNQLRNNSTRNHFKKWLSIIKNSTYLVIAGIAGFAPTYLILKKIIPKYPEAPWFLPMIGLSISAILQLSTYLIPDKGAASSVSLIKAVSIGVLQGFGALPGISRLNITLVGAQWLKISPHRAFEFSTLLQIGIFLANPLKNLIIQQRKFSNLYGDLITHYSLSEIGITIICGMISYVGLALTWKLNQEKELWKISPYFIIPLTFLWIIKKELFLPLMQLTI
jgi:undecaprenyl-diphosphatase